MLNKPICNRKINCLALSECERYLTYGDVNGNMFMLEPKKSKNNFISDFAIAKSLKGSLGSIRDIQHVPNSEIVVTCGLDRYLRVFNYKTYEDMPHLYIKNRLNTICLWDYSQINTKKEENDDENSNDDSFSANEEEEFEEFEDDEEEEDNNEEEEEDDDDDDSFENI